MKDDQTHKLWAYIHRELGDADKRDMENDLRADKLLREELDGLKAVDQQLKMLIPMMHMDEAELEGRILDLWELDQKRAEEPIRETLIFPTQQKTWWQRLNPIPLALAASVALLLGATFYQSIQPLRWGKSEFLEGPIYRNASTQPAESHYTVTEKKKIIRALEARVRTNYRQKLKTSEGKHPRWELQSTWQELEDGILFARVTALNPRHTETRREWSQYFNESSNLDTEVQRFADQIADELMTIHATTPTGDASAK